MNVQDIVTRVRRTFGDEAAVQVSDADVMRWINDGQIEIVKHNDNALQTTSLVSLVANQSTYALPADLLVLRSLRYKFADMLSFSNLRYKNMQQFDETMDLWDGTHYSAGHPVYFTTYENNVVLFPTPNQASTNGLKILYNDTPTAVTGLSDALSLPLIYHNILVQYCMWQASLLDEDHEPGVMYQKNFRDEIDSIMSRETADPSATYPTITVLEGDM